MDFGSLLLGIAAVGTAISAFIILCAALRYILPHVVGSLVTAFYGVAVGATDLLTDVYDGSRSAWSKTRQRIFDERRVRQILKESTPKRQSNVDGSLIDRCQAEAQVQAIFRRYGGKVRLCLATHQHTAILYSQAYASIVDTAQIMGDPYLWALRDTVGAYGAALHEVLEGSGLAMTDSQYARTFVSFGLVQQRCGANCPFWGRAIDRLPELCVPAQFVEVSNE